MYEKIIEIIIFVIGELSQNKQINDIDINELREMGYTKSEISTAFSWLVDRMENNERFIELHEETQPQSFRVLHDSEQDLFTDEAWSEMLQLNTLGLLKNSHIEMLIDRAAMMGMQVIDSTQLKTFVASTVFNAWETMMPGSRFMLNGTDSIN